MKNNCRGFYSVKKFRKVVALLIRVYPGFSKQNGYKLQLQSREIFRARMGT